MIGGLQDRLFGSSSKGAKPGGEQEATNGTVIEETPLPGGVLAQKRLRHVEQVAIRDFDFQACAPHGYFLEVASEPEGEVLVYSDPLYSMNPTWAPVCAIRHGCNLTSFQLRAVPVGDVKPFWASTVQLSETDYLCDKLEALVVSPPVGVPLLRLGTRWHAVRAEHNAENGRTHAEGGGSSSSSTSVASPPRLRNAPPKPLQVSQIVGSGQRMSEMLDGVRESKVQTQRIQSEIEQLLLQGVRAQQRHARRLELELRVSTLRRRAAGQHDRIARLRDRLEAAVAKREAEEKTRSASASRLQAAREAAVVEAREGPTVYSSLRMLWLQLKCRRMRMLYDAFQVYPVVRGDGVQYHQIRDLSVGGYDTLRHMDLREKETVGTALGMIAHLLGTLASILEVPLRISIHQAGCSRSSIVDIHHTTGVEKVEPLPLYYSNQSDKLRFEEALRLLRSGLWQILYSRGYFQGDDPASSSGNLLELAELILTKEIWGEP